MLQISFEAFESFKLLNFHCRALFFGKIFLIIGTNLKKKIIRDFNPLHGKNDATAQYYLGLLLANSDKLDQKIVLVIFLKMVSNNVWQKSVKERNLIQSKA